MLIPRRPDNQTLMEIDTKKFFMRISEAFMMYCWKFHGGKVGLGVNPRSASLRTAKLITVVNED